MLNVTEKIIDTKEVLLARELPKYVAVVIYAILFGLGYSFELYIGNPTAIIYALVGIGFVLNYLMLRFHKNWTRAHNSVVIQGATLDILMSSIEDGTIQDMDGLKKESDEQTKETTH